MATSTSLSSLAATLVVLCLIIVDASADKVVNPDTNVTDELRPRSLPPSSEELVVRHIANHMNKTVDQFMEYLTSNNLSLSDFLILLNRPHPVVPVNNTTVPASTPDGCYCSGKVRSFATAYRGIHGYVSLVVCLFGTVANGLNVAVLTKKEMVGASINRILTALAIADMLVMLEYVPFSCYMYLWFPDNQEFPFSWAVFILFHMHFTQVLHTISICLTLALAVWRFIAIRYPQHSRVWCTEQRCFLAILISYTLPLFVCSPSYFLFTVKSTTIQENHHAVVLYHLGMTDVAKEGNEFLFMFNFWVHGVVIKLIPCAILTVISCWLIMTLVQVNQRKQALKGYSNCNEVAKAANGDRRAISRSERRTYRTTRMLVAVLLLFLLTEFPQGILGLLSGVLGKCFFKECYHRLGEFMDILALLNGAINFILYCSMSRQFRATFGQLFKPRNVLAKWAPAQTSVQSTYV